MFCRRGLAERGANMLEYVGITIVVAGVVVALAMTTTDIPTSFANGVCRIVQPDDPDCRGGVATASPAPGSTATGPTTSGDPTSPTGDPTGGTTDPNQDPSSAEYDEAKKAADEAAKAESDAEKEWGNIDKELLDLVAELVGFNSAKDCFTKGDIGACLETLLTAIPWGKLFKAAKMVPKIWKLFRRFQKLREKLTKARKAKKKADDRLDDALKACTTKKKPGNSFTPGTRVLLADGTSKPIEGVRTGDRVLATDPGTGLTQARRVTDLIIGWGTKRLVDVSIDLDGLPGGKAATVTATANHPFWVADAGLWINAGDLVGGDQLRTETGQARTVTALRGRTEVRRVHNLTVEGLHTYYVLAGGQRVLVHNDDPKKNPCDELTDDELMDLEEDAALMARHSDRAEKLGFNSTDEFADYLTKTMKPGSGAIKRPGLNNGREAFFDEARGVIIIRNAQNPTRSTVFKGSRDEFYRLT